ncbi:DNRLRE domain-containing protein [Hathewaya limosa]|uniref:Carbohydrate-binding module family 96 domain-containing protein n=1 Tax=Hathewaya limosa TaxID=1536 RepID=A0ABU0JQU0_HATLI|nr:DNRLRE domain-containing protein [Hathewaya limosa]MDQ0479461.1 hypothetical protein [Hathewaya limosa]
MIQTISVTNDSFVYEGSPYTNYEGAPYLYIGNNTNVSNAPSTGSCEVLLYFDLSQIPTTSTIQSAQLKLYVNYNPSITPVTLSISTLGSSFNPSLIDWNMTTAMQTTSTSDTIIINGSSQYVTGNVTDIVKNWVNGTVANNGILLQSSTPSFTNGFITIGSVNNSINQYAPVLEITFSNSSTSQTEISTGDYDITTSTSQINGQNVSTTYAVSNKGVDAYDKALAVLQLNYGGNWYDTKAAPVLPGGTAVLTSLAGNTQSRLELLGTIFPTLYSFVSNTGAGNYNLQPILDVFSSSGGLAEPYNEQVGILYSTVGSAQAGVAVNPVNGVVTTTGASLSGGNLTTTPVTQPMEVTLLNIPSAQQYNLTFTNMIYAATSAQITSGLSTVGSGITTNLVNLSSVTNIPTGVQITTNYSSILTGVTTIYKDAIISSNKPLNGINVDIYYAQGTSGGSQSGLNYQLLKSNVSLTGEFMYLSQITGQQLNNLGALNGKQDNYQIVINPSTTATGSYELSIDDVAGLGSVSGITPQNKMKYLDFNNIITINLPFASMPNSVS